MIVEALTDNRNRTASSVRSSFSKYGGALGETNSVSFQFNRVGQIRYPAAAATADAMLEAAIEAGADDCESSAGGARGRLRRPTNWQRAGAARGAVRPARAGRA